MIIPVETQAISFGAAFGLGFLLGLFYDLLRPLRRRAHVVGEGVLDLLYWLLVTCCVFAFVQVLGDGRIHLVTVACHLVGAVLYFRLLSPAVRRAFGWVEGALARLFALIMWPFRRVFSILSEPLAIFLIKIKKSLKKFFSFLQGWYRIRNVPKGAGFAAKGSTEQEGSMTHAENKKGWSSGEDRGVYFAGLYHHRPSEPE